MIEGSGLVSRELHEQFTIMERPRTAWQSVWLGWEVDKDAVPLVTLGTSCQETSLETGGPQGSEESPLK